MRTILNFVLIGSSILATVLWTGCTPPDSPAEPLTLRPNLVLFSIDTLRADHLSLYGYSRPTSPFLDELAEESAVFDYFFHSGGGTLPSHMSLFTSFTPQVHGINTNNPARLSDDIVTLTEHLKNLGYDTHAITDGGWMSGKYGFDQGFDSYHDAGKYFVKKFPLITETIAGFTNAEPFFLFVHTYEVHSKGIKLPYGCPAPYLNRYVTEKPAYFDGCRNGLCASQYLIEVNRKIQAEGARYQDLVTEEEVKYLQDLYDGCINYVDDHLRQLVAQLQQQGLWENTLLVVTSDHGEEFFDHGLAIHNQGGWEEMIHLPLLIRPPQAAGSEGVRVQSMASTVDVMPTILDLLDIDPAYPLQGRSLRQAMENDRTVRREAQIGNVIRTSRWKYFSKTGELYDLAADRGETLPIQDQHPQTVIELEKRLQELKGIDQSFRKAYFSKEDGKKVEMSDDDLKNLQALGYLN